MSNRRENRSTSRRYQNNNQYKQYNRSNRNDSYNIRDESNYGNDSDEGDSLEAVTMMFIKDYKIGKLIGKGGHKIRSLQEESNARIVIDKQSGVYGEAKVILSGIRTARRKAEVLIKELFANDSYPEQTIKENIEQNKEKNIESDNYHQADVKDDTTGFGVGIGPSGIDWTKASEEADKWMAEELKRMPKIIKYFYEEDPIIANMSSEHVAHIRQINNKTQVTQIFNKNGTDLDLDSEIEYKILNPVETFEQAFKNYPDILEEIRKQGFEKPSPIQCQAWPVLLSGQDLIGIAQTGTGKTLAFLLPALIHINGQTVPRAERKGPNVLVLAPTRELALQIEKEVGKYSYHGIKAVCVYGGGDRKKQIEMVKKGVQIIIATPGRLNDLVQANVFELKHITYLVLDEADRMLDLGFEPQVRRTLAEVRQDRQMVMTSATWPPVIRRMAESFMKNPIQVNIGSLDLAAVHSVTQKIYLIDEKEKDEMMFQHIREMAPEDRIIVFFGKKLKVDDFASELILAGIHCQSIHGGRDQEDREESLNDMRTGVVNILLATDIASRGLDIEDITHVFNFDFPRDIEEYVHRVGRTGRAGRTGESITFMTRNDWKHAEELIKILEKTDQEVPEGLRKMAERYDAWKIKKNEENRMKPRYSVNRFNYG